MMGDDKNYGSVQSKSMAMADMAGDKAFLDDDKQSLQEKISKETGKIMKMKIENDIKVKELQDCIKDLMQTKDIQRKNIIELQMELEKLNDVLCNERRLRDITLNKVATTKKLCTGLENCFKELSDSFKHCKSNRDMVIDAYENASLVVSEIKKKNEKNEFLLKQKIQEMENQILVEKNSKVEQENIAKEFKKEMFNTCEQFKKQLGGLFETNKILQHENNQIVNNMNEQKGVIFKLEFSLEAEKEKSSKLEIDMTKMQTECQEKIKSLEFAISTLKHETEVQENTIENLRMNAETNNSDHQQQINLLDTLLTQSKKELDEQHQAIEKCIAEEKELATNIEVLRNENLNLTSTIDELQHAKKSLEEEHDKILITKAELEKKVVEMEAVARQNCELNDVVSSLKAQYAVLEDAKKKVTDGRIDDMNNFSKERNEMLGKISETEENLRIKENLCQELRSSMNEVEANLKKINDECNKYKGEVANKISQLEFTIANLNKETTEKSTAITSLLDELKLNKEETENFKSSHNKRLAIQNDHIDSLKETIVEHESTLKKLREDNSELKKKLTAANKAKTEAQKKLANVSMKNKSFSEEPLPELIASPMPPAVSITNTETTFAIPKIRKINTQKKPQKATTVNKFICESPGAVSSDDGWTFDPDDIKKQFDKYFHIGENVPLKRVAKRKDTSSQNTEANKKKKDSF